MLLEEFGNPSAAVSRQPDAPTGASPGERVPSGHRADWVVGQDRRGLASPDRERGGLGNGFCSVMAAA
jgi:hypothetical protein